MSSMESLHPGQDCHHPLIGFAAATFAWRESCNSSKAEFMPISPNEAVKLVKEERKNMNKATIVGCTVFVRSD